MCRECKLTYEDLEDMTVGMCLDYIDNYVDEKNPNKESVRQATQDDYDNF